MELIPSNVELPTEEIPNSSAGKGQPGVTYVPDPRGGVYVCWGPMIAGENPLQFGSPPTLPAPTIHEAHPGLLSIVSNKGEVHPIQLLEHGTTTTIMTTKTDHGHPSANGTHGVIYIPAHPDFVQRYEHPPADIVPKVGVPITIPEMSQQVPPFSAHDLHVVTREQHQQQLQPQQYGGQDPPGQPQRPAAWNLQYYFTYSKNPLNVRGQHVEFYIHGSVTDISAEPVRFLTTVTNPAGVSCEVFIELDVNLKFRYLCHFHADHPGFYCVSVKIAHPYNPHIQGSPFNIAVSRDYGNSRNKTRIIAKMPDMFPDTRVNLWGLSVDENQGKIYLADKHTHQIHILGFNGEHFLSFGKFGREAGQFFRPCGLALDPINDRLLVADKNNHRICIYTSAGDFIGSFGRNGRRKGEFCNPWGVAASPDGTLIAVADTRNHRIQLFNKYGEFMREYSENQQRNTKFTPCALCFDPTGTKIYVSDYYNETASLITVDMMQKSILCPNGNMSRPSGIAIDPVGNILICDSRNDCIRVFTANGYLLSNIFGTKEKMAGPMEISVLRSGVIIVLDRGGTVHVY